MKSWKVAALAAAFVAAAGLGAALAPAAQGQARARVVPPRAQVLTTFGGGSRIGVSIAEIDAEDAKGTVNAGVMIEEVDDDSPASKAGLKKGDIIVEFDGERVRSVRQFTRLVSETPSGRTVSAALMREGQRLTVSITPRDGNEFRYFERELMGKGALESLRKFRVTPPPLPATPLAPKAPALEKFSWFFGTRLGISTTDLSPQLAEYFGTKEGVLVSSVETDSAASKAGVKAGDVITTLNGTQVDDSAELRRRLGRLDAGEEFSLGIVRDRKAMTLKGKLDSPTERRRSRTIL